VSSTRSRRALRYLFVNRRTGAITVAQWPNVWLSLFIVAAVVSRAAQPSGALATGLRVTGVVALLVWGLDEVARGVNPFRRILGTVVVLATVANLAVR
jgi:hypothetical protein